MGLANTIVDLMMDLSNVSETTNFIFILAEGNMNACIKLGYIIWATWRSEPNFVAIHPIVVFWLCNYKTCCPTSLQTFLFNLFVLPTSGGANRPVGLGRIRCNTVLPGGIGRLATNPS